MEKVAIGEIKLKSWFSFNGKSFNRLEAVEEIGVGLIAITYVHNKKSGNKKRILKKTVFVTLAPIGVNAKS